ncbi:LuxR family two component transcriptional regulator [Homoserinimonas aerilata]|uniref:LuxR family two component transcriptional regulator n=1 Tax=Homoserinimonas aerilata TaxID=1162970 RepID=A0A542YGY6_9MICO|nr:response regulator transcription factor [Homoserinimonas aerilata]TQL47355.1 LuxR family two component transcriptional regulator [Homoserinimonas aerilata]
MRIVIAEDSVLLKAGLERLLNDAGHTVLAAVENAEDLLKAVSEHSPDLAVVDVRMPPTYTDEGIRAAVLIRAQNPEVSVLVLSQYVEERYAGELIADNSNGLGYLLKDRVADVEEFLAAVAEVGEGGTVLDPEVVAQIVIRSRRGSDLDALTTRERGVLQLMAEGRSNIAIAKELFIVEGSVEKHISSIFQKLGLPIEDSGNRRVLAVLRYLNSRPERN